MSDFLAGAGLLAAAGFAATSILLPPGRLRSATMLAALVLFPILIAGDQWHSAQIADLRDDPPRLAALIALALAISGALAYVFQRWPILLPLAIVAALPFRVPLHAGGDTANLLVPLYLVIAGGVLAAALRTWAVSRAVVPAGGAAGRPTPEEASATAGGEGSPAATGPAGPAARSRHPEQRAGQGGDATTAPAAWLPRILAAVVVLYALQTLYSPDFSKSLQNVCFFFVPFSLVYGLLRDVRWDGRVLVGIVGVLAIEAVVFVAIGSVEYVTKSLFWNDQVIRSNEFHTYFRVNSVFWDPNIYGRYLALLATIAMAALLWTRERRGFALLTLLVAIVWVGLVPTFSQSSFIALLFGLAVLAALKWSLRWTLTAVAVGAVLAALAIVLAGGSEKLSFSDLNNDTSGRANLVSGGIHLFAQRPVYGYGSGSFPKAYREHVRTRKIPVSVSHTEPITVAAEQGLVGFAAYAALLVVALWTMTAGLRGPPSDPRAPLSGQGAARVAVLATFVALLVHTMSYAGFFEDPITWALLALAVSLHRDVPRLDGPNADLTRGTSK